MIPVPAPRAPTKTARRLESIGTLRQLRTALMARWFASRLYPVLLRPGRPAGLVRNAADPWPGDADRANALFQGRYRFAEAEVRAPNRPPWQVDPPTEEWAAEASSFAWLRDFRAYGGEAARRGARGLVGSWLQSHGEWDALAWQPDILGRRLLAWCSHADFLLDGAEPLFRRAFHRSLARQARHLERAWPLAPEGPTRVAALAGLVVAQACVAGADRHARTSRDRLEMEVRTQILGDGCHASRDPSAHLRVLRELIWTQTALDAAEVSPSPALRTVIDHMGPMLAFFRHGDGALAAFQGGNEERRAVVAETLAALPERLRPRSAAPSGRYERLTAGPVLALIDAGAPPADPFATDAHASALAFEFSIGRERLVVNCGHRKLVPAQAGADWRHACRATAAHSTLVLGNTNSAEIRDVGLGARPGDVTVRRQEDDGNLWLDLEHDGYLERFGLFHRRRFYLASDGTSLRGADLVDGPGRARERPHFAVRFHLHPM